MNPAPEFSLTTEDRGEFTRSDLLGHTTLLVFYPFAFSPVCTDQLNLYQDAMSDFKKQGALVLTDPDANIARRHQEPTVSSFPGANLIFDALAGAR